MSTERGTGVVKRKYKLAGRKINGVIATLGIKSYIFFPTTTRTHHSSKTTVAIQPGEMDHFHPRPLRHTTTYIDITGRERIFEHELSSKISDPHNGFKRVARLNARKWAELQALATNILSHRMSDDGKKEVLYALLDDNLAAQALKNWGIS
jgi:hypothetical protein